MKREELKKFVNDEVFGNGHDMTAHLAEVMKEWFIHNEVTRRLDCCTDPDEAAKLWEVKAKLHGEAYYEQLFGQSRWIGHVVLMKLAGLADRVNHNVESNVKGPIRRIESLDDLLDL